LVRRTWGLSGQTPVLPHRLCHYQKISAIGALTISPRRRHLGLYLHLYPAGDIPFEAVAIFLRDLRRHLGGGVTLIWDNWGVHRSGQTKAFLEGQRWLSPEWLPPYAPELNAMEYFWTQSKYHGLSNHALMDLDDLEAGITEQFLDIRAQQDLLRSFVRQTHLPIVI
jgi:transposase